MAAELGAKRINEKQAVQTESPVVPVVNVRTLGNIPVTADKPGFGPGAARMERLSELASTQTNVVAATEPPSRREVVRRAPQRTGDQLTAEDRPQTGGAGGGNVPPDGPPPSKAAEMPDDDRRRRSIPVGRIQGPEKPGPKPAHTPEKVEPAPGQFTREKNQWLNAKVRYDAFLGRQKLREGHEAEGGTLVNHDAVSANRVLGRLRDSLLETTGGLEGSVLTRVHEDGTVQIATGVNTRGFHGEVSAVARVVGSREVLALLVHCSELEPKEGPKTFLLSSPDAAIRALRGIIKDEGPNSKKGIAATKLHDLIVTIADRAGMR